MNTFPQQLEEIILKEQADKLVPFFKSVPTGHTEELRKKIKSIKKEINSYTHSMLWEARSSTKQIQMLDLAGLGLLSKQDLFSSRNDSINLLRTASFDEDRMWIGKYSLWNYIIDVLQWRKVDWLTECLINHQDKNEWFSLNYEHLRRLLELGLIEHDKKLFVRPLVNWLTVRHNQTEKTDHYEFIKNDALILESDLFSIFDYETNIHWVNHYIRDGVKPLGWQEVFVRLVEEKRIDRYTVLQKSLEAMKRDFNKNLLGWFRDLFLALKPTVGEKITLQHELFELFNATTPLPVNFAVEQIKVVYPHDDFDTSAFLTNAENVLTRSDVKTSVKNLLGIFEKIGKLQTDFAPQICQLAANAFLINDSAIHEKAAKLITTFGDTTDEMLTAQVGIFADSFSATVREKLADFLEASADEVVTESEEYVYQAAPQAISLTDENRLTPIATWNDLLFQIGKARNTLSVIDLELLFDGMIRLQSQFPADFRTQLKPYLSKKVQWLWGIDGMLTALIYDWAEDGKEKRIESIKVEARYKFLSFYKHRFLQVFKRISSKSTLPLLSTPTHDPYWIDAETLVDRLEAYQQAGAEPDYLDMSLAIARTIPVSSAATLEKVNQLEGFYKDLLLFFLSDGTIAGLPKTSSSLFQKLTANLKWLLEKKYTDAPKEPEKQLALWAVAARTKAPSATFTVLKDTIFGNVPNVAEPFELQWEVKRRTTRYNNTWTKKEEVYHFDELNPALAPYTPVPLGMFYSHVVYQRNNNNYEYFVPSDIGLYASIMPQYMEPFYINLLVHYCTSSDVREQAIGEVLRTLLPSHREFSTAATLFLASGLVNGAPVNRGIAIEVLIQTVSDLRLPVAKLGETLGKLLAGNYAPVQRLVDSLTQVKGVSAMHDSALIQLLEMVFPQITGELPKNLKKLLELYADLCAKHRWQPTAAVKERATEWQKNATLKKVAAQLV